MDDTGNLEKILDNTPFLLCHCTRDLHYRYVTRAYAAMFGRTPEEIRGKPIMEIMGRAGFETIRPHVESVLRGQRVEYEAEVDLPSIGPRHYHIVYVPERDEQSQVVGYLLRLPTFPSTRRSVSRRRSSKNS